MKRASGLLLVAILAAVLGARDGRAYHRDRPTFLLMAFLPAGELYPYWFRSLAVFLGIALLTALLALRSIGRSGEQV